MAIIGETITEIQLIGQYNGQKSFLRLPYAPTTPGQYPTPTEAAAEFAATKVPLITVFTNEAMVYTRINVLQSGPNEGPDTTDFINGPGTVVGDGLPPQSAFSFLKNPDNSTIEGTNLTPFSKGGFRLMGVSESNQNQGLIAPGAYGFMELAAAGLLTLDINTAQFGPIELKLYMQRPQLIPNGPPQSAAFVDSISPRVFVGTQNSRKY